MVRTQLETIEALRAKVRELKAENNDLVSENESLNETIQSIYQTTAEFIPDEEESDDKESFDEDLDG